MYAIDPSPYMLRIARRNAAGLGGIRIEPGSSRHIPFKGKFDLIYTSLSFHHWRRKAESLSYLAGLLNKHGEIRLYEVSRTRWLSFFGTHRLDIGTIYQASRGAGLTVKDTLREGPFVRVTLVRNQGTRKAAHTPKSHARAQGRY